MGFSVREVQVPPREELRAFLLGLRWIFAAGQVHATVQLVLAPLGALASPFIAVQLGRIVSLLPAAAAGRDAAQTALRGALLVLAIAFVVARVLDPLREAVAVAHGHRYQLALTRRLIESTTSLPGLAHFEDPSSRDRLHIAGWSTIWPQDTFRSIVQAAGQIGGLVGYLVVAADYAPWVPILLVAAALPEAVSGVVFMQQGWWARSSAAPSARKAKYFGLLGLSPSVAKESRVFGLTELILGRRRRHWLDSMEGFWSSKRRSVVWASAFNMIALGAAGVVYVLLIRNLARGDIDHPAVAADARVRPARLLLPARRGSNARAAVTRPAPGPRKQPADATAGTCERDPFRGCLLRVSRLRPERVTPPRPGDPARGLRRDRRPERSRQDDAR